MNQQWISVILKGKKRVTKSLVRGKECKVTSQKSLFEEKQADKFLANESSGTRRRRWIRE